MAYKLSPTKTIRVGGTYNKDDWRQYLNTYRFNLDHSPRYKDENWSAFGSWNHTLSNRSFYEFRANMFSTGLRGGSTSTTSGPTRDRTGTRRSTIWHSSGTVTIRRRRRTRGTSSTTSCTGSPRTTGSRRTTRTRSPRSCSSSWAGITSTTRCATSITTPPRRPSTRTAIPTTSTWTTPATTPSG